MLRDTAARRLFLLTLLALVTCPILALNHSQPLRQYEHQSWQTSSGLPQNTVHSIVQTQDGFLWLATEGGLVRFDGVDFSVFDTQTTPQMKSNFIYHVMEDSSGGLWISTGDGLLYRQNGIFKTFGIQDGLPSSIVWSTWQDHAGRLYALTSAGLARKINHHFVTISGTEDVASDAGQQIFAEDAHGTLWLATSRGLIFIQPGAASAQVVQNIDTLGEVQALTIDTTGRVWIGGRNGLAIFANREKSLLPMRQGLPSNAITALLADANGSVWIGTSKGLALFRHGSISVVGAKDGLANVRITRLFRDREGAMWAASDHGLARITGNHIEIAKQDFSSNSVLSIYEDREGSMWVGTDAGGLSVLRAQKFSTVTAEDGLSDDFVRAVFQDHAGSIWIGTNGGGLNHISPGGITSLRTANGLSSDIVLTIAETGSDLWVGTPDGLNRIHNGHIQVLTSADGLADDFIRSLYADQDGSLWIGTRHGLSHLAQGKVTTYSKADGLGSDVIGTILRDHSGNLWVGTMDGLSRLHNNTITNLTAHNGLSSNIVTTLFEDAKGDLWIGTSGGGLNELANGKILQFPSASDSLPDTVYGILEDTHANLWLSARKGIYRVSEESLNRYASRQSSSIPVSLYGTADGMKISECSSGGYPSVWRMNDGTLWFATLKGAAFIHPESAFENQVPPLAAIEQVMVDDQSVDAMTAFTVAPGHSRITIHYAGLSFVAPKKVRFRYKLEGLDRKWIDAGNRRTAYYTNLPPGKYSFLVYASNNDGVWSTQPAEIHFRIQPHYYQTLWFYGLIVLAIGFLVYGGYRWRVHQVENQYRAVLAERGRIAREIHDTLAQDFVGVSVQLELIARLLSTSTEAAREQLERTKELVRTSLAEARSSIWNLRSQGSEAEFLPDRFSKLAEATSSANPLKVKLHVRGTYRPVDRTMEDELLRIAQEAVSNAVRHAQASRIDIELHYDAKRLRMEIVDDGRGFEEQPQAFGPEGHFGLQGMRERAAKIGAQFSIQSSQGSGTRVSVTADAQTLSRKE
ncbi:MAG: sensor histidine kinase [Acidobacteriaceae bacterium]